MTTEDMELRSDFNFALHPPEYAIDRLYIEGQDTLFAIRLILKIQQVQSGRPRGDRQEFHANVPLETAQELVTLLQGAIEEAQRRVDLGDH